MTPHNGFALATEQTLLEGSAFRDLLLNDTPMIDTRAPVEFAQGSFPHSQNLPLMTDDERAAVGTCYKQQGQQAAVALGHQLVCGTVKEQRVQAWLAFKRAHPEAVLFCFRGGMRSEISQRWCAEHGVEIARIQGGYKAMRRYLIDETERFARQQPLLIVSGRTGSAKTTLLHHIDRQLGDIRATVDLEGLANHRGSAFGRRVGGQPSQISFELALAIDLLKAEVHGPGWTLLEDESRLIGRCALPLALQQAMKVAPIVILEADFETRRRHSWENYILDNLTALEARYEREEAFALFAEGLTDALSRIQKRLGGARYQDLRRMLEDALNAHRQGDAEAHLEWIGTLLRDYYDPMYDYQLRHREPLVRARGNRDTLAELVTDPEQIKRLLA